MSRRPLRRRICRRFADSELAVPLTTAQTSLVYKCALASPEPLATSKQREFLLRRRRRQNDRDPAIGSRHGNCAEFAKHAKEEQEHMMQVANTINWAAANRR